MHFWRKTKEVMEEELGRAGTGYVYIQKDRKGRKIGLRYAPLDAASGLSDDEIHRLPMITPQGDMIPAVPKGQRTDFLACEIPGCKEPGIWRHPSTLCNKHYMKICRDE